MLSLFILRDYADGNIIPLPDDIILALSKILAFADDIVNVTPYIKSVLCKIQNIVGKKEKMLVPNNKEKEVCISDY